MGPWKRASTALLALLLGVIVASSGWAATGSLLEKGLDREALTATGTGEWTIDAAKITYDPTRQVYEAEGSVHIHSGDRSIEADWALLDTQKQQAELQGNIMLRMGKDWLKGEHAVWNLETQTGWVDGGLIYFAENHFYVQGKSIVKSSPTVYDLQDGYLTSCNPDDPDWKLRYEKMKVNIDGIAWASHTSFWVKTMPLLYAPFVALPVQMHRQSGFLIPWGGISDLNGVEGELPFYWAIREDMDATFYARYMQKRGFMSGVEYRIANKTWGEGIWLVNYLNDQADKQHLLDQGYPYQAEDRFWVRAHHAFDLPYQIEGRLDLDIVSDRNYLMEFAKGSTSYEYSDKLFREFTGMGILNDRTVLARENALDLTRRWDDSQLTMDVRVWDQLDKALDETTLQRVPALSYSIIPTWIGSWPIYYTLESSNVNFWRPEGDTGSRVDIHPRVAAPLHWGPYLDIEPSAGLRTTGYWVDWEEGRQGEWQGRILPDARLEMSSRLNRVYPVDFLGYDALQHSIRPEISYEYVPSRDMEDFPYFDWIDRDMARHDVRYGLTTFLTGKDIHQDAQGKTVTDYRELARLQLYQVYSIDPSYLDDFSRVQSEEGFSGMLMRVDLMPRKYVTLSYDTELFDDDGTAGHHDLIMTLDSEHGQTVKIDYQFRRDLPVDELITRTDLKVTSNVYVNTYHDYSFDRQELYKQGYGIRYMSGCWGIGIAYERELDDDRVAIYFDLLGLGGTGKQRLSF